MRGVLRRIPDTHVRRRRKKKKKTTAGEIATTRKKGRVFFFWKTNPDENISDKYGRDNRTTAKKSKSQALDSDVAHQVGPSESAPVHQPKSTAQQNRRLSVYAKSDYMRSTFNLGVDNKVEYEMLTLLGKQGSSLPHPEMDHIIRQTYLP